MSYRLAGRPEARRESGEKADGDKESPLLREGMYKLQWRWALWASRDFISLVDSSVGGVMLLENSGKHGERWQKIPKLTEEVRTIDEMPASWCGPFHKAVASLSACDWTFSNSPTCFSLDWFPSPICTTSPKDFLFPINTFLLKFPFPLQSHSSGNTDYCFLLLHVKGAVAFIPGDLFHWMLWIALYLKGLY